MEPFAIAKPAATADEALPDSGEPTSVVTEKAHPHSDLPPSLYQESHKVPLVLEILKAPSAYQHFDMEFLTNDTDRFVIEEIQRLGLPDEAKSYQKVVESALDKLKIPEGTDIYTLMDKLHQYLRIQNKLYSALKEKEELMTADPLTMSASQLKRYLEYNHGI